ncbi:MULTISPECIES: DUF3300 domain-containing protein [unclassified Ensifer]|uniref:DUF3300 domain-containing protein n=1 Tax=unclassified Ensifer TaxID=2633371 RepID=UPI0008133669|nr:MULTISPECIES: DUF3300 domain-containing protein [unclassified Ensifer]OCP05514.1 hypothetical protein BC362_13630 [Ensifer sp. LC14]OCP06940.1 hypothetical protein BBX50_22805 [Ensifer sp. LC11]OCP07399.1 hypothetical protein BC374_23020 [Ensifer sp. LC13]OCP31700.1 hypothetical protein BC364_22270 [Ensifer sp. LC499]
MIRQTIIALGSAIALLVTTPITAALAQQTATAPADQAQTAPEPLSDDELEVLVARIALYPDELVALVSAAALYPLQIVEAERFLEAREKKPDMKPKDDWDGSIVSLLNYPQIVKMMSEDLEWTQSFGEAIANQQKDVLIAIQQLRDEAVAKNIIKTDDKVKVVHEGDNVVIQAANPETIYVPQYPPEMLYEPDYAPAPIGYYDEPYPAYWYPGAAFFAGAVTGAAFAAIVDWDDWGVWGGNWGGDVDIDCNKCFNNIDFNGKLKMSDIDWKNVDRSKLKLDRSQLQKFDRTNIKNNIKANGNNNLRNRAAAINRDRPNARPGGAGGGQIRDVRKSTLEGLKAQQRPAARPGGAGGGQAIANARAGDGKPSINRPGGNKPSQVSRTGGKKKMAAKAQNRSRKPSGLGNVNPGRREMASSRRGGHSMGGGHRGGGRPQMSRGGGRPQMHRGGGGGRGGGRRR